MIERIENLEIEKKVKIYRKCIKILLSKSYTRGDSIYIEGIEFSYNDLLEVCYYVVPIYGNNYEQMKFFSMYGFSNYVLDDDIIDSITLDRMLYIYEFNERNCQNKGKIKKIAKLLNIRIDDVKKLANDYAVNYLKYNIKDYKWHILCKKRGDITARMSYDMLFDLLLRFDDDDDIVYLIDYSKVFVRNYHSEKLERYIKLNHSDKSDEEKKLIYDNINKKILMYKNIKQEEKLSKKDDELDIIREFIAEFLNSAKTYKYKYEFCRENGMRDDYLIKALVKLKNSSLESDKKLYDMCMQKIDDDKRLGSTDINYTAKIIADYVLNGVKTENGVRDFDLIDFYTLTNLKIRDITMACEKFLEKQDYIKIRKFFVAVDKLRLTLMNSKKAVDLDIEFDCKKDKDGFPILGTGRRLTEEEREEILELFDKYNIPLYLFKIAVERIKKGVKINDLVVEVKEEVKKKEKIHI